MIRVQTKTETIIKNVTLNPDSRFGGWLAVNTGTATATILGYPLAPGEGLDFTKIGSVIWDSPIDIVLATGARVQLTRLMYIE